MFVIFFKWHCGLISPWRNLCCCCVDRHYRSDSIWLHDTRPISHIIRTFYISKPRLSSLFLTFKGVSGSLPTSYVCNIIFPLFWRIAHDCYSMPFFRWMQFITLYDGTTREIDVYDINSISKSINMHDLDFN